MRSDTGIKIIFCCLPGLPIQLASQLRFTLKFSLRAQDTKFYYRVIKIHVVRILESVCCQLEFSGFSGRSGKEIHFQGGFVLPL